MKNETTAPSPIDRMIDYLITHYAFRYNTVMNCTEYRPVDSPVGSFEPLDLRTRRRIILEVQREGIEVSQNDIRNYIDSDYVRSTTPSATTSPSAKAYGTDTTTSATSPAPCQPTHRYGASGSPRGCSPW